MTTVKAKKALPKGVLAQDEYTTEEIKEEITLVSLLIDFKIRDLECNAESIVENAVAETTNQFYIGNEDTCIWARAQVLEYKKV